jgi:hypothetical protein
MARAASYRGYLVQLLAGQGMTSEEFGLIASPAAEGTLFLDVADPRGRAEAAPVVERFRASGFEPAGYTLYAYAAVQVWAQAAEKSGSLQLQGMIASLRQHQFDTVWARSTSTRRETSLWPKPSAKPRPSSTPRAPRSTLNGCRAPLREASRFTESGMALSPRHRHRRFSDRSAGK